MSTIRRYRGILMLLADIGCDYDPRWASSPQTRHSGRHAIENGNTTGLYHCSGGDTQKRDSKTKTND